MEAATYRRRLLLHIAVTLSLLAGSESANSQRSIGTALSNTDLNLLTNIVDNLPVGKPPGLEDDIPGPALTPDELAFEMPTLDYAGEEDTLDPLEDPSVFQGDIWFKDEEERRLMTREYPSGTTRNAVLRPDRLWPYKEIPYVISSAFSKKQRQLISAAIKEIENKSCIKFVPRKMQEDYIHLYKGDGCSSQVGRIQQDQAVSLADACIKFGVIIHELMHAVGFWHEQSRFDRDDFILINWHNIKSGMEHNFKKYEWDFISNLSMPYDLDSIMHYGHYSFSMDHKRGIKTIEPIDGKSKIGQRRGLSKVDIEKLNKLYSCGQAQETKVTTPPPEAAAGIAALGECRDNFRAEACRSWAERGECENNPGWMLPSCKFSCKNCKCMDYDASCSYWAQKGSCADNPSFMLQVCQKSCGLCAENGTLLHDAAHNDCSDHNQYCETWASDGLCLTNMEYMLTYCKKSCTYCKP